MEDDCPIPVYSMQKKNNKTKQKVKKIKQDNKKLMSTLRVCLLHFTKITLAGHNIIFN